MATQSPFSLLGQLAERAAQVVQPPAWLVHEAQHRMVLLINHVLMQEPAAMQRLQQQAGRVALVQWRQFYVALAVTRAGLFNLADDGSSPDLRLEVLDANPLALAQTAMRGGKPAIRIEGDVQLAAEMNWLVENVSWDVEEDLARIIGDAPAHRLGQVARAAADALRQLVNGIPKPQQAAAAASAAEPPEAGAAGTAGSSAALHSPQFWS